MWLFVSRAAPMEPDIVEHDQIQVSRFGPQRGDQADYA
jgi:hypothetical protein